VDYKLTNSQQKWHCENDDHDSNDGHYSTISVLSSTASNAATNDLTPSHCRTNVGQFGTEAVSETNPA